MKLYARTLSFCFASVAHKRVWLRRAACGLEETG